MKLVKNWKRCWRWFSVNAMGFAVALQGTWIALPSGMKQSLPEPMVMGLTVILLVFGIIGRVIEQDDK